MSDADQWILGLAMLGFASLGALMLLGRRPLAATASILFAAATLFLIWALRDPGIPQWIGLVVAALSGAVATWRAIESGR